MAYCSSKANAPNIVWNVLYTKYFKLCGLFFHMQFEKGAALYSHEIQREGGEDVLYINYIGAPYVPSLSDSPEVMERTIDALIENPNVSRIVFVQQKTVPTLEYQEVIDSDAGLYKWVPVLICFTKIA